MNQPPDPARSPAEERHPEVFEDPDAGQVFPDDNRPPEDAVVTGLKRGCIWAVVIAAVLLLILALALQWAWREASPELPAPDRPDRTGVEADPRGLSEEQVIGDQPAEADVE